MKTIVIWDQCGEEEISFFVVNEAWARFNNIYGNCAYEDEHKAELGEELSDLVFAENGNFKFERTKEFPIDVAREPNTIVIVAGFLP
jgi:hypothetical protein